MIPWGAIAVAVWAASRQLDPNRPQGGGPPLSPFLLVVALRWFFGAMVLATGAALAPTTGGVSVLAAWAVALALFAPTLVLEGLLVPLAMPRAAYWWTFCTMPLPVLRETRAGRCLYGLRAALRQASPDPAALAHFESTLFERHEGHTGLTVTAAGLLAAARGNTDLARALLASASRLGPEVIPAVARRTARAWLVADALARGDVDAAIEEARARGAAWWPSLVADELERRRGVRAWRRDLRRPLLWALAAHRAATWRFVQGWRERPMQLPAESGDALADAAAVHRAMFAADPMAPGYVTALADACRRWDVALASPALRAQLERRALAVGGVDLDALLADFARDVEADLAAWADAAPGPLRELSASTLGDRVLMAVRERELSEIDALLEAFERQAEAKSFDDMVEAWSQFARLRWRVHAALRRHGDDVRDALASGVFHGLTNWCCYVYNDLGERALGREVFVWIRDHADGLPPRDHQLALKNALVLWY